MLGQTPIPGFKNFQPQPNAADLVNLYKIYKRYKTANDPSSVLHLNLPKLKPNKIVPGQTSELEAREIEHLRRRVESAEKQLYQSRQEANYWRARNYKTNNLQLTPVNKRNDIN